MLERRRDPIQGFHYLVPTLQQALQIGAVSYMSIAWAISIVPPACSMGQPLAFW